MPEAAEDNRQPYEIPKDFDIRIISHPVISHKLTHLRSDKTEPPEFRRLLSELTYLLTYETMRTAPVEKIVVKTPLARYEGVALARKKILVIPIMRAGLGMVDAVLELLPMACVGHIGMYRDEQTLEVHVYYTKLPEEPHHFEALVLDPMLATGHTLSTAIDILKSSGVKSITVETIISAPEGINYIYYRHKDIKLYTLAIDKELNPRNFILPGLGDAGDRLYGTDKWSIL